MAGINKCEYMADETKLNVRSFSGVGVPRAVDDNERIIEGYAIVFNQRSKLIMDWNLWKRVIEVISPTAVNTDLINRCDVIANIEHNNFRMLARSLNGKGTLTLTIDSVGLKYRFACPKTADGEFAYEMVKRGDITGSSFAYRNDDDECNVVYSKEKDDNGDDVIIRTVNKIDSIYDVSIVLHPAYMGTSVEARNQEVEEIKAAITRSLNGSAPASKNLISYAPDAESAASDLAQARRAELEAEIMILEY